jgi:hypothetical protein
MWLLNLLKKLFVKEVLPVHLEIEVLPVMPITVPITTKTPREILYETSKRLLTPPHDVSPKDVADDEYGCAESLWNVLNKAFPNKVGFPLALSTRVLFDNLKKSTYYKKVSIPDIGDIIISVTGSGNGQVPNGHVGICGRYGIMSNSSATGKWMQNFTYERWEGFYNVKGGMKTHYFRRIIN